MVASAVGAKKGLGAVALSPPVTQTAVGMLTCLPADSVRRYALRGGSAFAWQGSSHALLLHPPERDVTLQRYCSEQLKIMF